MLFQETILFLYESSLFQEGRQIQCSPLAMAYGYIGNIHWGKPI